MLLAHPAVRIKRKWVKRAISKKIKMKTARPSGIVVEMMKASGETDICINNTPECHTSKIPTWLYDNKLEPIACTYMHGTHA